MVLVGISAELNCGGAASEFRSHGLLTAVEFVLNPEKLLIASLPKVPGPGQLFGFNENSIAVTTHSSEKRQLLFHSLALWEFLQTMR